MAHSRRSGFPSIRSPRRQTNWGIGPDVVQGVISGTGKTGWTNGVFLTSESKATIVRIRGMLTMRLLLATSVGDGFHGAIGLCVITDQAFAAGVTAIPGPVTDDGWDGWMWHTYFQVMGIGAQSLGQDVGINSQAAFLRIPIDTKAMRKISDNQKLFGMFESTEVGVASITMDANTRVLLKLT